MNKKKWFLLILIGLLIFGYIRLFYKTYSNNAVPHSADRIAVIDVKRVINTLIWNFITTPSQWKSSKKPKAAKAGINWRDVIELPDYAFAFHCAGQPESAWYMQLNVKSEQAFLQIVDELNLSRLNEHEYASSSTGIYIYKEGKAMLIGNAKTDSVLLRQTTDELFVKKSYIPKETLAKAVDAKSHLAIYIAPNAVLQKEAILTANFDKNSVTIAGDFTPKAAFTFSEADFNYSSQSVFAAGFTQPSPGVMSSIGKKDKANISKALGFDADSFFIASNKSYAIDFVGVKSRTDSAVTYTYDDDFNKVEKVTVNNVEEPSYNFMVTGDSTSNIFDYLQRNEKLEKTEKGNLFIPFPFVKSYCSAASAGQLNITADNYKPAAADRKEKGIFFLQLIFSSIPPAYLKYLSDDQQKAISNLESIEISAKKDGDKVVLKGIILKKKNDRAIIRL
jgi:hypothetical protein